MSNQDKAEIQFPIRGTVDYHVGRRAAKDPEGEGRLMATAIRDLLEEDCRDIVAIAWAQGKRKLAISIEVRER